MDFAKTIGHEKQKRLFEQIVKNGRLAHAYVFVGPENIGKTTFALDLAQTLGADPIMDLILFDEETGLAIEKAREIQSRLSLTPVGKLKVAIVSYAENMTMEAANSLLMTLEEPPARSLLILVTSNFHVLLPTVASRIQRINFGLAKDSEISEAKEITKLAGGRIGLARRLAKDEKLLDFYRQADKIYEVMRDGSELARLKSAESLAQLDDVQIHTFLKFVAASWIQQPTHGQTGRKILGALADLKYNLNVKLLMDNLFLS